MLTPICMKWKLSLAVIPDDSTSRRSLTQMDHAQLGSVVRASFPGITECGIPPSLRHIWNDCSHVQYVVVGGGGAEGANMEGRVEDIVCLGICFGFHVCRRGCRGIKPPFTLSSPPNAFFFHPSFQWWWDIEQWQLNPQPPTSTHRCHTSAAVPKPPKPPLS